MLPTYMARSLRVLFIDDDETDRFLFQQALSSLGGGHSLFTANGMDQAVALLEEKEPTKLPLPHLVLVDLKMTSKSGFEFLEWLHRHPRLRALPAIVFSGSVMQEDIDKAYGLGARSFLSKPARFDDLVSDLKSLLAFWSGCELPPSHGPASGRSQLRAGL